MIEMMRKKPQEAREKKDINFTWENENKESVNEAENECEKGTENGCEKGTENGSEILSDIFWNPCFYLDFYYACIFCS